MKYKVGDVLLFGDDWMLVLNDDKETPNVTIARDTLFLGGLNPHTEKGFDLPVLFNIFDIKRKVEENGY